MIALLLAGLVTTLGLVQQDPSVPKRADSRPTSAAGHEREVYRILKTFQVGGEGAWDYLAVDSDAHRLYVPRSTRVMVLDTETGASAGEIPDTSGVHGVALANDLGKGFTSNGRAGTSTVFDLKTLKALKTVPAGKNPDAIVYEPVTKRVFVCNGTSHDATAIDAQDLTVAGTIALGGKPEFAVVDGVGKVFVNIEDTNELVRIDAKKLEVEQRIKLAPGNEPTGLAIDPAHHRLFAVCHNQKMIVVDAKSGDVLATPAIGKNVDGAAFDATGNYALSSNGEGTLSVVATEGDKPFSIAQTLKTAQGARTMVLDPKTRRIYLPTAEYEASSDTGGARRRPAMKPGSFKIVVVGA